MSPIDQLLERRIRLEELRTWERALAIVDAAIIDAFETSQRTTVYEEAPLWRFVAERFRKLKGELIAAASEKAT